MNTQQPSIAHSARLRRKARRGGFTIAEITLALIIFTLMTIMFAAVFPMAVRGAQYSSNYAEASMVAQHKMDQLRSAGFNTVNAPPSLVGLNIIDSATPNADGSYNFTASDNLVTSGGVQGYFPAGSQGTVKIVDYNTVNSNVPVGKMVLVTIKVNWVGGGVSSGSYTLESMISFAAQP